MNKKGYTLVELLAVVIIIGILAGVTTMAVGKYLSSTKDKAYEALARSAIEATENYIADNDETEKNNYSFDELKDGGYLEKTADPDNKNNSCNGKVIYTEDESTIYLYCTNRNLKYIYKNGNLNKPINVPNPN